MVSFVLNLFPICLFRKLRHTKQISEYLELWKSLLKRLPKVTSAWWKLSLTLFDALLLQSKILFSSTKIVNFQICKNYKNKIVNIQYLSNVLYMINYRSHLQTAFLNQVQSQFAFHACWIHRFHAPQSIPFLRLLEIIYIYIQQLSTTNYLQQISTTIPTKNITLFQAISASQERHIYHMILIIALLYIPKVNAKMTPRW